MITEERLKELADANMICKVSHEERVSLAAELLSLRQQVKSTQKDDGWIEWGGDIPGDEEPVLGSLSVEVKFRKGDLGVAKAGQLYWPHTGSSADIIAYRIVGPRTNTN